MPGPPPKPPGTRVRRHKRNDVGEVPSADAEVTPISAGAWAVPPSVPGADGTTLPEVLPAAPGGRRLKATEDAYQAFRTSAMARLVTGADLAALVRLFDLYDEIARSQRAFSKERLVDGTKGNPKLNPLAGWIMRCSAEARGLEDRFGLTPVARLRLGVTFGKVASAAARANEEANRDDDHEEEDPRLSGVIDVTGRPASAAG